MIKSYTDIEQSKKLAEILPIESADMSYSLNFDSNTYESSTVPYKNWIVPKYAQPDNGFGQVIPCWSLAALLESLPKIGAEEPMVRKLYYASKPVERYICEYSLTNMTSEYDNPVDACVAMIEKLHELNLL